MLRKEGPSSEEGQELYTRSKALTKARGMERDLPDARYPHALVLTHHRGVLRVPVRAGGSVPGLGGRLVLRAHALRVRHLRRGAAREGHLGGGVMLRKAKIYALDRLLLERFGDKMGRGLALQLSGRREFSRRLESLFAPSLTGHTEEDEFSAETGDNAGANRCLW